MTPQESMDAETLLYIPESKVRSLLTWESTLAAVEASMKQNFLGQTVQKPRSVTATVAEDASENGKTLLYTMPGYLRDTNFGALACKLVTSADNSQTVTKLPNVMANIALFNEQTGQLQAIIAGTEITTWRTAAASVIATKQLAKNFDILGILGTGVQGRIHAIAFQHFFKFKKVQIWNHNYQKTIALVDELNGHNNDGNVYVACDSPEMCLSNADIIVTATSAPQAFVKLDWIKNNAHINAVGVTNGRASELELDVYQLADVYIDHWEGARTELADLETIGVRFLGEIGGLVEGTLKPPTKPRLTIFQSLGMAVEDCAMARMIYDRYLSSDKGVEN